jgi:hypothetical protein
MRRSAGWKAWAVGGILAAAPAAAQDVRVSAPLELHSGLVFAGGDPTPFAGGLRTALLARLGPEATGLAGVAGGWLRDGHGWTAAGGLRAGFRVPGLGARDAGLYVTAEALKGRDRLPITVTIFGDLTVPPARFVRFGLSFTRDVDRRQSEAAVLIGVDLARWAVDLFGDHGPRRVTP